MYEVRDDVHTAALEDYGISGRRISSIQGCAS